MYEKKFKAVPPQAFTANGTSLGSLAIADASLFKVKQQVIIKATSLPDLYVEIKRIEAASPHLIYVGDPKKSIDDRTNISAYTVALGATIELPEDQKRPIITADDHERAVYEEEPTVAKRVVIVDKWGNKIDETNPLAVAATFDGDVQVGSVRITACDNDPVMGDIHSSVRIAGPDCDNEMIVNTDGSINVNIVNSPDDPGLVITHNEISSVVSGVETTILTLVSPPGDYRIAKIDVSGDNVAHYRVKINGSTINNKRSYWCDFNQTFVFEGNDAILKIPAGDTLTVTVIHNRPNVGSFEATVFAI